jgi:hypothetical protein
MAFPKVVVVLVSVACVWFAGCRHRNVDLPAGPFEVCYTSVRGGSPHVVDFFVIIGADEASSAESQPSRESIECFVVPRSVEGLFRQKLGELLTRYSWSTLRSLVPRSADEPFRRLSVKTSAGFSYVEIHEDYPADEFLNDTRLKQFYAIVSEVRLLGETFGVQTRVTGVAAAEKLGMPLERKRTCSRPD